MLQLEWLLVIQQHDDHHGENLVRSLNRQELQILVASKNWRIENADH